MDEADVAQNEIEFHERARRAVKGDELPAVGTCYNCGENLQPTQKFCDPDCEADYRKRMWHLKQRNSPSSAA